MNRNCITRKRKLNIDTQYRLRLIYKIDPNGIHSEILHRLQYVEFQLLNFITRHEVNIIIHKKFLTKKNKRNKLILHKKKQQIISNLVEHKCFNRFVNLSETDLSVTEHKMLEKGFSRNIQPVNDTKNFESVGKERETSGPICN